MSERAIDDLELLRASRRLSGTDGEEPNEAFNEILCRHRDRLKRMVGLRMNQKLQGRLDASDVIQDTFVEASRALEGYLDNPKISVFMWLRRLAGEKLIQAHRKHLGAEKRTANREQPMFAGVPAATSQVVAIQLSGKLTSPSNAAQKREDKDELMDALDQMGEIDREILMLRHFEQLSNHETAEVVGISYEAVKKRYIRALDKLRTIMTKASDS
ncbi:sigma-70 family RNA polymerase sigma factor [Mariniblastus fucicola]|uniref:ECF RNA polymerase sigma factor SigG n=1 Tax=Mariniblastus fucicola TaxID=980251 RepID=A0A5B9P976_9BACT|nr:sigma-70 family RNA polymerase sigma factor [Mariniblastus fucicola]QEG21440.1 ECF RNA polymerase sigma factor SigG [Mariniblastus fucicola]